MKYKKYFLRHFHLVERKESKNLKIQVLYDNEKFNSVDFDNVEKLH